MSESKETTEHEPDSTKLPKVLQSLPWQRWSNDLTFFDGDELLVAVPVCRNDDNEPCLVEEAGGNWAYDLTIVVVNCDEDYFDVNDPDDAWGWTYHDIDYFVNLSSAALNQPAQPVGLSEEEQKLTAWVEKAIDALDLEGLDLTAEFGRQTLAAYAQAKAAKPDGVVVRREILQNLIDAAKEDLPEPDDIVHSIDFLTQLAIAEAEAALAEPAKGGSEHV